MAFRKLTPVCLNVGFKYVSHSLNRKVLKQNELCNFTSPYYLILIPHHIVPTIYPDSISDMWLKWISKTVHADICKWLGCICIFRHCYPVCLGCYGNGIGMQTHTERCFLYAVPLMCVRVFETPMSVTHLLSKKVQKSSTPYCTYCSS